MPFLVPIYAAQCLWGCLKTGTQRKIECVNQEEIKELVQSYTNAG